MDAPPEAFPATLESSRPEASDVADQELVHRAKQGDRGAFDQLMLRHQQGIISLAYRMLGNYDEAVELAQEAFFRMWRGLPCFREEAAFRTWAYQITLNLARHRRRWHARHRTARTVSLDAPAGAEEDDPPASSVPDPAPGPREEAGRSEIQEAVRRAVAQLPVPLRTVTVLRDIQGLPYEQIAEISEERIGTIKSRLHRARAILKTRLAQVTR